MKRIHIPLHYFNEREPGYLMHGGELDAQHGAFPLPDDGSLRVRLSIFARSRSFSFAAPAALHAGAVQC